MKYDEISSVHIYTRMLTISLTTCWYLKRSHKDQDQQQMLSFCFNQSEKALQKLWKCLASHVSCCLIVSTRRVETLPQPFAFTQIYPVICHFLLMVRGILLLVVYFYCCSLPHCQRSYGHMYLHACACVCVVCVHALTCMHSCWYAIDLVNLSCTFLLWTLGIRERMKMLGLFIAFSVFWLFWGQIV